MNTENPKIEEFCKQEFLDFANQNPKIAQIWVYTKGFVPNSYRWPAPAIRWIYKKSENWAIAHKSIYDRKRSGARGDSLIFKTEKEGTIFYK